MIDTWRAQAALTRLDKAVGFPRDEDISKLISEVEYEIEDIECGEEHCDDSHGDLIEPGPIDRLVGRKLARIRLGVYSEEQDGSVQEILEEIERILR